MRPNARKNQKLLKQFPCLGKLLALKLEPLDGKGGATINDLTIKVQKADGDLMYRLADNVGLANDSSWVGFTKGPRKDQVMRQGEYLFAINEDDTIAKSVEWPTKQQRGYKPRYAHCALWAQEDGDSLSGAMHDQVKCLVWVTVEAYHKSSGDSHNVFGEFCDRSVCVTVYGKPDVGFYKLEEESSVYDNLFLSSDILMHGALDGNTDLLSIDGRLAELCQRFQEQVYFNGMMDIRVKGEYRGASGQFGPVKVLCVEMCGYERVMLQDASSWISFQLRPDSKSMYVLGMGGTLPQLRNLTNTVVKLWNEQPELRDAFKSDEKVSVM
ncbi:MAG: hypothetical protein Q8P73_04935 [bacterium]|nr:hypothetical protein [bacterium]